VLRVILLGPLVCYEELDIAVSARRKGAAMIMIMLGDKCASFIRVSVVELLSHLVLCLLLNAFNHTLLLMAAE
jgi:hypothetical protein